ncbi:hypothetical protein N9O72_00920 [bacterium]|nr:hypothetical protein [bacterium]
MKKFIRIISINFIIFVLFLIILEITARVGIFILRGSSTIGINERTLNLDYEPYVMFGHKWEKQYDKLKPKEKIRIMLLGGSTGEAYDVNILEKKIKLKTNIETEIFNSAAGAYNARQQLVLLSIWGKRIDPEIIISFDGANDILHSLRGENEKGTFFLNHTYSTYLTKPYLGSFVYLIQNSQLYSGIIRLSRRYVSFDKNDHLENIDIYLEAKKNISLISKAYGAYHISILQPYLGFKKNKSDREKAFTFYDFRDEIVKDLFDYTDKKLTIMSDQIDNTYYFNSQNLFNTNKTIFSDDFHFIDNYGYELLSDKIIEIIIEKDLLIKK